MASAIQLMRKLQVDTPAKGIGAIALDTGVGFGASYALGQVYHRYGDKWAGRNAPRLAAIVGKLGAIGASLAAGGSPTFLSNFADSVGQAGVNAIGLEMGLRHARKATGKKAVLIPASQALPAGGSEMSYMGALGQAAPGRGLSWDQIEELARGH